MQALAHTRVEASRGICRDAHSFTHKGAEARMWRVGCGGHACAGTPSNQLTGPGHLSMFASPHDTCSAPFAWSLQEADNLVSDRNAALNAHYSLAAGKVPCKLGPFGGEAVPLPPTMLACGRAPLYDCLGRGDSAKCSVHTLCMDSL